MKALEYLKKIYDKTPSGGLVDNALSEAIKELEALDGRSCEGCKHSWQPNNQIIHKYYCEEIKARTHGDFYCNRWEAK